MLNQQLIDTLKERFLRLYQQEAEIMIFSPGRINIIGEHTDYSGGYVLPATINRGIYFLCGKNSSNIVRIYSEQMNDWLEYDLRQQIFPSKKHWQNYILGVLGQFIEKSNDKQGFNCVIMSDLPIGAGLSSSAALEVGFARVISEMWDMELNCKQLMEIAHRAETEFVGVQCGIMDQFAVAFGRKGYAMLLNASNNEFRYIPIDLQDYEFVLVNSMVKHSLGESAYNQRVKEIKEALEIIKRRFPEVENFSHVSKKMLRQVKSDLPPVLYRRAKYVVEENFRTIRAAFDFSYYALLREMERKEAFRYLEKIGLALYESHYGLRDLYQVSCAELDYLVDLAEQFGLPGARMMGGGFGGCTINLVPKEEKEGFIKYVSNSYQKHFGIEPQIYEVEISNGVRKVMWNVE